MKYLLIALPLLLAACNKQPQSPLFSPKANNCSYIAALPSLTLQVGPHSTVATLRPGVDHALISWQAGGLTGSDNVNAPTPDIIALGCLDNIQVQEILGQ